VITAIDGAQGLQMAMDNRPDVIVCDIEMPHINGLKMF
jgi:YesN/AraC family two-component response regulator